MKKTCILIGSPRKNGNTHAILTPVIKRIKDSAVSIEVIWLYDLDIEPCIACRKCQKDWNAPNCMQKDDMEKVFDVILDSDLIILATPIYSWYCTPPMKATLDRLVYAMNKYYGERKGPSLWKNKDVAIITTCGYPIEHGADLFEEGIKRYCKHSQLNYKGMFVERHLGYNVTFMDQDKEIRATKFADKLLGQ